jgi:protein phosphatase
MLNCGDSRLYRMRQGQLCQLTTDHSLNKLLGSDQHSNVITNCIGGGTKNSFLDLSKITDDVKPTDIYLLCSDGLTDMVTDDKIESLLRNGADANTLCQAAIDAGGLDNVSACVIDVEP